MVLDLNKEMAWVTFLTDGFETKWHPVTDVAGNHLEFDCVIAFFHIHSFPLKIET